jgi:hypothetical protein
MVVGLTGVGIGAKNKHTPERAPLQFIQSLKDITDAPSDWSALAGAFQHGHLRYPWGSSDRHDFLNALKRAGVEIDNPDAVAVTMRGGKIIVAEGERQTVIDQGPDGQPRVDMHTYTYRAQGTDDRWRLLEPFDVNGELTLTDEPRSDFVRRLAEIVGRPINEPVDITREDDIRIVIVERGPQDGRSFYRRTEIYNVEALEINTHTQIGY